MKTIAITIDEAILSSIDEMLTTTAGPWRSRSQLIRQAVQQFLREMDQARQEEREAVIFRQHRERLAAQTQALLAEQAEL